MTYELIALDMDGTLLDSRKKVLPSSVEAISEAVAAGKSVAIASGRCPKMVSMYNDVIPDVRYAICCAGAVVYDIAERRTLAERDIAPAVVARAIRTADEEGSYILEVTAGEGVYMQLDEIEMSPKCGVGAYEQLYRETSELVDDAHAVALDPAARVSKLNFHFEDVEARDRTHARLADADVVVTDCEASSLELTCPDIDKGTGLAELARIAGIDVAQTIAVGDADNDLPMLRAAGLGVAMGNALPSAIDAADVQVADNDHGGVAEAIRRYLLAE